MRFREKFWLRKGYLLVKATDDMIRAIERTGATELDFWPVDPRELSGDQRKIVFALCTEICMYYSGFKAKFEVNYYRKALVKLFCDESKLDEFSMRNVDKSTCSELIEFLVEFILENNIPTSRPLGELAESINHYLRMCLVHRKCSICGRPADCHHIDAIGLGGNREKANHLGRRAIALCRGHHSEAHTKGVKTFFALHHLPHGVKLDEYLCGQLGLNVEKEDITCQTKDAATATMMSSC